MTRPSSRSRASPFPTSSSRACGYVARSCWKPRISVSWPRLWASRATEPTSGSGPSPSSPPHGVGARRAEEAVDRDHAADAVHALARHARAHAALLDRAAHRDRRVGSLVESSGGPAEPDRAMIVERADQRGVAAAQLAEPVIVGVVGVHDVDRTPAHEAAQPRDVAGQAERVELRLQREPGQGLDPRFARLGLEAVARDQAQLDGVPARAEPLHQADRGVGAPRPPAIGDEVQHGQGPVGHRRAAPPSSSS